VVGCCELKEVGERLSWPAIVEIAIHIEPAEHPFNWVDRPILVAIELLEMVVGQFRVVQVWNTCTNVMIPARIVALGAFQHTVVHEIGSRLHDGFESLLLMNFHTSRALLTHQRELSRYQLGLFLHSLRLALCDSGHGALRTRRLELSRHRLGLLLNSLRLALCDSGYWALGTRRLAVNRYRLSLFLNSLRLVLRNSRYGAFRTPRLALYDSVYRTLLNSLDRQGLPLLGWLLGRLGFGDDRSRLLCFFCSRDRLPDRSRK